VASRWTERARPVGNATVAALRRALARKTAELIRSDPEEADRAIEMGIVDRSWLEDPGAGPISTSTPVEILERFLERSVEKKPSRLSSLGLSAIQLLSAQSVNENGEPQVLSVVFTDLEGFTSYTNDHGDDAALELLNRHHRAAGPVVRRWDGRIVKHLGDGLLCTFSSAAGAIRGSLELLDTAPAPLRLRAGGHVGAAIVSRNDVVGHVVNIAARVTESAKGGQVVITHELVEQAGQLAGVRYGRTKSRRFKGISDPLRYCQVTAVPGQ
jgi:class 3 adenylate cyclase